MRSRRPLKASALSLGLVLMCVGHASAQGPSHTRAFVQETFGAWQVYCRTFPRSSGRRCALVQSVTAEDRPNLDLTLMIYRTLKSDKTLLRAVVPLGVLLPKGLVLRIDKESAGATPFVRCTKNGCVAEAVLKEREIDLLKKGETALFVIYETIGAGIGIPMSLEGFTDCYTHLK